MPIAHAALEELARSLPLFSLVAPEELDALGELLRPVELLAGQVLFREGDPAGSVWVLGAGVEVTLATSTQSPTPVLVNRAVTGDTVGEMALVDRGHRSATAIVARGGVAYELLGEPFAAFRAAYHPVAFKIIRCICRELCAKLRATSNRIVPPTGRELPRPAPLRTSSIQPELLDELPQFRALPAVVKLALAQKLGLVELSEVTPLFAEGEDADAAYFILSGEVAVGRGGRTLAVMEPGQMFGMVSAIDEGKRSASCITTGPARLLRLSDADFDALFAHGNRFAYHLVDVVAHQLVEHLRQANRLLPRPVEPPAPVVEGTLLPLELELELQRRSV